METKKGGHAIKTKAKRFAKKVLKDFALGWYFPRIYAKASEHAVDKEKVLFLSTKEFAMPEAFKVLYPLLKDTFKFDVEYISLEQNNVSFFSYFENARNFLEKAAIARCIYLEDASDVMSCVKLRPETSVVQLWHGCGAFKKWGMSTADLIFGESREEILRHPFYKNLSLVTVSSPEVVWAYEEAMVLEGKGIVKPLGVSRTDLLFDEQFRADAYERLANVVPAIHAKKVILYAPTFRGRVASAEGPDKLDIYAMREDLKKDYILVIKHHPFVKKRPDIPKNCRDFAFDVSNNLSMDALLCCADICISDYSSLVFEFSLFERPMVFFAYDIDDYNDWRGFYYSYDELTPGPVVTTTEQIIDYIQHLGKCFNRKEVKDFKERFMRSCDGHSTERILRETFGDDLKTRMLRNDLNTVSKFSSNAVEQEC